MAPLLVPLATAMLTALVAGRPAAQRAAGIAGSLVFLASALALAALADSVEPGTPAPSMAFGGWDVPYAIVFVADRLGATFVVVTAIMGVAALVFQLGDADAAPPSPTLVPLVHAFLAGATGAFLTGDLFNLYVWFEVVLISSLGMVALRGGLRALDAALTYFVLNVVGTLFVLVGVALVYATSGHLNYAAVLEASRTVDPGVLLPAVAVLSVGFLLKAGGFPVFGWLPATYHTMPAPLLAVFAALGTKVGVYAILRTHAGIFHDVAPLGAWWGWIAVATMVTGVLGAAWHWDIRRILAFHSISQIGYMLLGIALDTVEGAQSALVYAVHHSFVKGNLFLIAAIIWREAGSYDLRRIGGLHMARPWLASLFLLQALSLVGIPPTSGFWAKLLVVRESLAGGHVAWTAAALVVGALTMYSMVKIWSEGFWKAHPDESWTPPANARLKPALAVAWGLALVTTAIGLWPEPLLRFTEGAARHLFARGGP